jgi:hypothetical protein
MILRASAREDETMITATMITVTMITVTMITVTMVAATMVTATRPVGRIRSGGPSIRRPLECRKFFPTAA